jgi:hypothetical protein
MQKMIKLEILYFFALSKEKISQIATDQRSQLFKTLGTKNEKSQIEKL